MNLCDPQSCFPARGGGMTAPRPADPRIRPPRDVVDDPPAQIGPASTAKDVIDYKRHHGFARHTFLRIRELATRGGSKLRRARHRRQRQQDDTIIFGVCQVVNYFGTGAVWIAVTASCARRSFSSRDFGAHRASLQQTAQLPLFRAAEHAHPLSRVAPKNQPTTAGSRT